MDAYVTEEQQWEAIKKWFKTYGEPLSWIVLIGLALTSILFYWRHHQFVLRAQASDYYMELVDSIAEKDPTTTQNKAEIILNQYPNSPYATLAAFALAFEAVERKDVKDAETKLAWIIENSKQKDFQMIARIRLMRLLIAEKKLDDAMTWFTEKNANGFLTLLLELKGDILLAQNDINSAREAYEKAYQAVSLEGMEGPLLKMKMEELGMVPAQKPSTEKKA